MKLGSESGGIVYHLRAFFLGQKLWPSHWAGVHAFLNSLKLDGIEELHLVGPSGGYSLPVEWLKQFKKIYVYEPDFLARRIFQYRFGKNVGALEFRGEFDARQFERIASGAKAKSKIILFANVLGQIDINLQEDSRWSGWIQKVAVASFHDVFSISFPLKVFAPGSVQTAGEFVDLINRIWDPTWGIAEINEHHVPGVSNGLQLYGGWVWQITPNRIHWIEGVYTAPLIR